MFLRKRTFNNKKVKDLRLKSKKIMNRNCILAGLK